MEGEDGRRDGSCSGLLKPQKKFHPVVGKLLGILLRQQVSGNMALHTSMSAL